MLHYMSPDFPPKARQGTEKKLWLLPAPSAGGRTQGIKSSLGAGGRLSALFWPLLHPRPLPRGRLPSGQESFRTRPARPDQAPWDRGQLSFFL